MDLPVFRRYNIVHPQASLNTTGSQVECQLSTSLPDGTNLALILSVVFVSLTKTIQG